MAKNVKTVTAKTAVRCECGAYNPRQARYCRSCGGQFRSWPVWLLVIQWVIFALFLNQAIECYMRKLAYVPVYFVYLIALVSFIFIIIAHTRIK